MTDNLISNEALDEKLDQIIEMLDFIRINYLMPDTEIKRALEKADLD